MRKCGLLYLSSCRGSHQIDVGDFLLNMLKYIEGLSMKFNFNDSNIKLEFVKTKVLSVTFDENYGGRIFEIEVDE